MNLNIELLPTVVYSTMRNFASKEEYTRGFPVRTKGGRGQIYKTTSKKTQQ